MDTETPQLAISRVFDAPRALVFRAFTDPDHLATWWGPSGNSLPRDEIEFDVRPGGFQRWTEVAAAESAQDPGFKRVWESLQAFRQKFAVWNSIGYLR